MSYVNNQLALLNDRLSGSIQHRSGDRIVQFSNDYGTGTIIGTELGSDIAYLDYSLKTNKSLEMNMGQDDTHIFFVYCSIGKLSYTLNSKDQGDINALQTAILGGTSSSLKLKISVDEETSFSIIRVTKLNHDDSLREDYQLNQQVFERFLKNSDSINYLGSFNLKIKEQLNQIAKIQQEGVIRTLLIKGILHFTLGLEIMQYDRDRRVNEQGVSVLTKRELLLIEKASKEIRQSPEYPFTVTHLSTKYALSPAKLQEGFKFLNGTTVTNYVKETRLETAEFLLKSTDLNISEIVYTVGFTSRSYFSKIFKKKYKYSPRFYKISCMAQPVDAA